jgi:hypothetical protein
MKNVVFAVLGTCVVCLGPAATIVAQQQAAPKPGAPVVRRSAPAPASSHAPVAQTARDEYNALVKRYCAGCHNDRAKTGNLTLATFDIGKAGESAEVAERMIRKLQAGMMPPPGMPRPDPKTSQSFITALETAVDAHAAANPNPGGRTFPRLNRAEYAAAIDELLNLKVDAGKWLPLDAMSANFDNIADEQVLSPTLLEAYLNAAADISRLAVGDTNAPTLATTYTNQTYVSQHPWDHIPGAPYGTRGGMVVDHIFPADAEYVFELTFTGGDNSRFEDVDVSIDGDRVALVKYENGPAVAADGSGATPLSTEPIFVKAGQHRLAAAFIRRLEGPYEDLIRPHEWSNAGGGSGGAGITTLPQLRDVIIHGPHRAKGVSMTPSRRKIFTCRPLSAAEEQSCARRIVTDLTTLAYRREPAAAEVDRLMPFYQKAAGQGGFEEGIRASLEAILASPYFIFRVEKAPTDARAGGVFRLAEFDLASRLSFFLWGEPPDRELLAAASRRELSTPAGLERWARRMLADPRADALGTRFAAQWLRLQDLDKVHPDPNYYPNFDENLAQAMKTETVMFFNSLVKADRSVLDLHTADYTFVNEKLARHYGIQGVAGPEFRRVTYPDDRRRGILGHGSVLVQTSLANRTSPVLRGKWVMEVLLGSPPPPPPPNVPTLDDTGESKDGVMLTTRQRMELHRANPACNACHRMMDPIGLALDNFDATAEWRVRENGMPLDTAGDFYDGTKVSSLNELAAALLKRPTPLVRTFTENLMAYALGRRIEYYDMPAIRAIEKAAAANNYRMSSFIVGVIGTDAFRMKKVAPESTTTEAVQR